MTESVESLYQQALAGNVTAQIWWTKGRMGWKEKTVSEVTGKDGGPIEHALAMPADERKAKIEVLGRRLRLIEGGKGKAPVTKPRRSA